MSAIEIKEVESLTYEEFKKLFPPNYKTLKLEDAEVGPQPNNTIIIGSLIDVTKRNTPNNTKLLMKCVLKEIVGKNSQAECFETFFYNEYVTLMDEKLKKVGDSPSWVLFSNVAISSYTGMHEIWSRFTLKVNEKNGIVPKITIMVASRKAKLLDYAPLNKVLHGNRQNVFAVVKEIVKPPTILENKSKHTMLALIDPSCLEEHSKRPDLLLHIFFNDPKDHFAQPIEVGDILRLRDMLGDFYKKDQKMYGKMYNSYSITKFKIKEDNNNITPVTSYNGYVLTAQDKNKVLSLREWWADVMEEVIKEKESESNKKQDSILIEKRIEEITLQSTFNLYCLVKAVRIISKHEMVILRVLDGSHSKVYTTMTTLDNATQELCSQTDNAVFGSLAVDISVFEPLVKQAASLQPGDFVQLTNVTCVNMMEGSGNSACPIFDFLMNSPECTIVKLYPENAKVKGIQRRLEGQVADDELHDSQDEVINMVNKLQKNGSFSVSDLPCLTNSPPKGSKVKEKPKLVHSTPVSTKASGRKEEQQTNNFPTSNGSIRIKISEKNNLVSDSGLVKSTPTLPNGSKKDLLSPEIGFSEPAYSALTERIDFNDESSLTEDPLHTSLPVPSNTPLPEKENGKKKCPPLIDIGSKSKKLRILPWIPKQVYTVCDLSPKATLTDFCRNANPGEKRRVYALLKHIHFVSEEPYRECDCVTCFHDWVWGLCTACGDSLCSSEMRRLYAEADLLDLSSLPCRNAACPEDETVVPFIKLIVCLLDLAVDNEFSVDLVGDGAAMFLGVSPSFKWCVGCPLSDLQQKMLSFQKMAKFSPFQVCLVKYAKPSGSSTIQICNTVMKTM